MRIVFLLTCLCAIMVINAQEKAEKLTNNSIISLHKAGLGKEVLMAKINASVCSFSVGTDDMVSLKKAGVPDEVIALMLTKDAQVSKETLAQKEQAGDRFATLSSGIYYEDTSGRLIELEPAVFSQSKQGSGLLTSITYGFAKTKQKSTLSGARANLQLGSAKPTFFFLFEKAAKGNLNTTPTWFSSAASPNEFVLVKLNRSSNKKSREVVTGSFNSYEGLSAGIEDSQKAAFSFEKTAQGVYKVHFPEGLSTGEYCFLYAGSAAMYGAAPVYKVFDFGVSR